METAAKSFQFRFAVESDQIRTEENESDIRISTPKAESISNYNKNCMSFNEIEVKAELQKFGEPQDVKVGIQTIRRVSPYQNKLLDKAKNIHQIATEMDVLEGVYEGGFKMWECTFDLVRFMQRMRISSTFNSDDPYVLDLGCGQGICGISIIDLVKDSKNLHVCFQDLNEEVLKITQLNVFLNRGGCLPDQNISFVSGDWRALLQPLHGEEYDLIVSSETLYNPSNFLTLANLLVLKLKKGKNSMALLSSKKYYFGIGGGTAPFMDFLNTNMNLLGKLEVNVVYQVNDGNSNIREILEIRLAS